MAARHDDYHPDFGELPKSKGIPTNLAIAVAIGVVIIFAIGAGVVLLSGHGHHWPWTNNLRIDLK